MKVAVKMAMLECVNSALLERQNINVSNKNKIYIYGKFYEPNFRRRVKFILEDEFNVNKLLRKRRDWNPIEEYKIWKNYKIKNSGNKLKDIWNLFVLQLLYK